MTEQPSAAQILWDASRSGSHAGRGFRYQDAVATELALRALGGELPLRRIVPEGLDDISVELDTGWLHMQAKSRREHVGPSGAGKSALIWMTAFATRHDIRWYRVKRVERDDVPAIARLAKGLEPAVAGPVGFVIDDLGPSDRAGFDALATDCLSETRRTFWLLVAKRTLCFSNRVHRGTGQTATRRGARSAAMAGIAKRGRNRLEGMA